MKKVLIVLCGLPEHPFVGFQDSKGGLHLGYITGMYSRAIDMKQIAEIVEIKS